MTDEEKNIFGNQLRERRNELNLTTQKVALDAEVGESTYKRLEAGDGNPRLDTLVKIVKCLKTDLNSVVPQEHLCKDAGIWQIVRKLLSMDKKKMNKASLMDIYMYNQHCKKQMDREYIREQCKVLGILEYEEKARMIAYKLFEQPLTDYSILTKEEQEYVEYYFTSGTYGTLNQRMQNEIHKLELEGSKHAEAAYIFRRLFPSVSWFRKHYRILDKCPFLIPFYGIIRLIVKPFSSWNIWTGEMKALARVKKSSGDGE